MVVSVEACQHYSQYIVRVLVPSTTIGINSTYRNRTAVWRTE